MALQHNKTNRRFICTRVFVMLYFLAVVVFFFEAIVTPSLNYILPFIGYGGTFRFHSISLGSMDLSLYWLMHGVGLFCMIMLCLFRRNVYNVRKTEAVVTAVLLAVFGFLGAKLLYVLENLRTVMQNGLSFGGVSFFGTVFLMPLVITFMALVMQRKPSVFLDYCTPAGIVMLVCIRTGCFFRGCCAGITFWIFNRPVTLPSQLLECTFDMLLLSFIFHVEQSKKWQGKLYIMFMGGYGIIRFIVEFTRNTPKDILFLSHGQWFSIICIAILVIAFMWDRFPYRNKEKC